jgi:hypothetical protein
MNTFFMNVSFSYVNDRALNEMHTFPMERSITALLSETVCLCFVGLFVKKLQQF